MIVLTFVKLDDPAQAPQQLETLAVNLNYITHLGRYDFPGVHGTVPKNGAEEWLDTPFGTLFLNGGCRTFWTLF